MQSYIITGSGNVVSMWGPMDPISIYDVAVQLGRAARWAGATTKWVSVLHHSLFCERVSEHRGHDWCTRAHVMAHDFHEAFTGDVPSPFKTRGLRKIQDKLDRNIFEDLEIPKVHHETVKKVDRDVLLAESHCFGVDGLAELVAPGKEASADVIGIIRDEYDRTGNTINGIDAHGVRRFLSRWSEVLSNAHRELGLEDRTS